MSYPLHPGNAHSAPPRTPPLLAAEKHWGIAGCCRGGARVRETDGSISGGVLAAGGAAGAAGARRGARSFRGAAALGDWRQPPRFWKRGLLVLVLLVLVLLVLLVLVLLLLLLLPLLMRLKLVLVLLVLVLLLLLLLVLMRLKLVAILLLPLPQASSFLDPCRQRYVRRCQRRRHGGTKHRAWTGRRRLPRLPRRSCRSRRRRVATTNRVGPDRRRNCRAFSILPRPGVSAAAPAVSSRHRRRCSRHRRRRRCSRRRCSRRRRCRRRRSRSRRRRR